MTTKSARWALLIVLVAVFVLLRIGRDRVPSVPDGTRPGRGSGSPEIPRSVEPDWSRIVRLAGEREGTGAGAKDIFFPGSREGGNPGGDARRAKVRKEPEALPKPPPAPEPPPVPPPPPPEDPLAAVRRELSVYKFVGFFRKSAGDRVIFLSKGGGVFLVKRGDVLVRGVVVAEIRDSEIVFLVLPDRKVRAPLRDNAPLSVL
ncbi:MAG: hypothetical protein WC899_11310 [bacterium]|jgi:hypothetical protein